MKSITKLILLIFFVILCYLCFGIYPKNRIGNKNIANFSKIKKGMSYQKVTEIMGKPYVIDGLNSEGWVIYYSVPVLYVSSPIRFEFSTNKTLMYITEPE